MPTERINLGRWSRDQIAAMLQEGGALINVGERIDFLSGRFLGVAYGESTLVGSADMPEALTVNLQAVDCFTYLDYIEAMRLADSFPSFVDRLIAVRYRGGNVAYTARRHFFTDWLQTPRVKDMTREIGRHVIAASKTLNRKDASSLYLAGIEVIERQISYIPAASLGNDVLSALRTGDYVGMYAEAPGLDVTHVGIAVRRGGTLLLRHASSTAGSVVEQDFAVYVRQTPGIIVVRPVAMDSASGGRTP